MFQLIVLAVLATAGGAHEAAAQTRDANRNAIIRSEARRAARQQVIQQRPFESPFQVGPQSRPIPPRGSTTVPNR